MSLPSEASLLFQHWRYYNSKPDAYKEEGKYYLVVAVLVE